jgi:23S rRNA (adenine-N6)-dimethyltransferase
VARLVDWAELVPGELIVDIGAGQGALTLACAEVGARVVAVEHDPVWARQLRRAVRAAGFDDRVSVVFADARTWPLPDEPFRVVANPPFTLSTELLRRLLDDPGTGPERCDLLLQLEVTRKRTKTPADDLRTAAWAPWWTFEMGPVVRRTAFRPVPAVDAAVLTVRRRQPAVLPLWMAAGLLDTLRPAWERHQLERSRQSGQKMAGFGAHDGRRATRTQR